MSEIKIEQVGYVFVISINRPEKKNAFTLQILEEIVELLKALQKDKACRVVVLTGEGDAFCSGVDLSVVTRMKAENASEPHDWKALLMDHVHAIALTLDDFDKPVIAAVNGPAVGAGMDLALMCDMRFLATSATLCEAYINLGVVPGDGGCFYLPRLVGLAKALELLLSGRVVDADEARELGLANHVFPDDELMEQTMEFAHGLAEKSPVALRMIKRATYQSLRSDLRTSLDLISSHMGVVQSLSDTTEAVRARVDGDTPRFEER